MGAQSHRWPSSILGLSWTVSLLGGLVTGRVHGMSGCALTTPVSESQGEIGSTPPQDKPANHQSQTNWYSMPTTAQEKKSPCWETLKMIQIIYVWEKKVGKNVLKVLMFHLSLWVGVCCWNYFIHQLFQKKCLMDHKFSRAYKMFEL